MRLRVIPHPADDVASEPLTIAPSSVVVRHRPMRVLDFDVECRPLHFYGDYVSKEITAIAWAWTDHPEDVTCVLLGEVELVVMLQRFVDAFQTADMVTGHFIRGFDLPLLVGALTEQQMPVLPNKLTHDTKLDLVKRHGLSGSQENIGAMLQLEHPKVQMNQGTWREANRLTKAGLARVRERVTGDVRQHIEMRERLLHLGYLGRPVLWKSGSARLAPYTP